MKLRPSLAQLKTFPCQTQFDFNIISKFRCSLILCSLFLFQNFAIPYSLFPFASSDDVLAGGRGQEAGGRRGKLTASSFEPRVLTSSILVVRWR